MNKKVLLWALFLSSLILVWCQKNGGEIRVQEWEDQENLNVWIANPASVYCEENGWVLRLEEGEWICMFDDGSYCEEWSYYRWECVPGEIMYNTFDAEDIGYELPEWAKTTLTDYELEEAIDTHFPKGYSYMTHNLETEETLVEENYFYPEWISHSLLIPEHATMASRNVINSSIQDGMIYTETEVTLQDDTVLKILYIVNPVTLELVATTVENWNISTNYQFIY